MEILAILLTISILGGFKQRYRGRVVFENPSPKGNPPLKRRKSNDNE